MRRDGFTLLETLVALSIVAVIGAAAYRGGVSLVEVKEEVTPRLDRIERIDRLFALLERDLSSLAQRTWKGGDGALRPPFHANATDDRAGSLFSLCRYASPHDVGTTGVLAVVGYRLTDDRLDYLVWPAPDRSSISEPTVYSLIDGVRGVTVRYLNEKREWQESWTDLRPPRLLSLTLVMPDESSFTRSFRVGS